eukprot:CAMPEP_0114505786 /NCGR_PEP_ID=MMETSP0109-20121206/11048_1 /TAXON_ID=29199 /ORGANISM="Chlorarachnion reptans, Strain CCCM449" /LENGTH=175 /DNA_ID=CAMNT_0001684267 /DNA_START=27 /DNA_END=551 /DNA_ORIENTATION=+
MSGRHKKTRWRKKISNNRAPEENKVESESKTTSKKVVPKSPFDAATPAEMTTGTGVRKNRTEVAVKKSRAFQNYRDTSRTLPQRKTAPRRCTYPGICTRKYCADHDSKRFAQAEQLKTYIRKQNISLDAVLLSLTMLSEKERQEIGKRCWILGTKPDPNKGKLNIEFLSQETVLW